MRFVSKRKLYESAPLAVKMCARVVPFGWIAGGLYRAVLKRREWIDQASANEIRAYQEKKLGELLNFATAQVPAYRTYRRNVERFSPFDALKEFPLLDKDTLQANMPNYLPRDFDQIPHYECSTGGTSGNQLKFYVDDGSHYIETAFMHRQWFRVGYTAGSRKATFRGVSFRNLKPGIYWQYNPIYHELQFSPFHMSEKTLPSYVEKFIGFKPAFLHGYPSAIDILSEFIIRHGIQEKLPHVKAVLLGSEGALPGQRERIQRAFNARVFSWYGHSERVVLAGECEKTSAYHHFPDYGILEIIDENGDPCDREGERGEIVGTGLFNRCMPLIRYRTGDYATRLEPRCECGRCWDRFTDVEGRWKQDMVSGKNGARISLAALNMHGPMFERVLRYQYYQDKPGICILKVMGAPGFSERDHQALEHAYRAKVGDELDFVIQEVADIPLTARGKLKLLDSKLSFKLAE